MSRQRDLIGTIALVALTLVAFGPGALDLDAQRMLGQAHNAAADGWHPATLVGWWRVGLALARGAHFFHPPTTAAFFVFATSQVLLVSALVRILGTARAALVLVLPIVAVIDLRLTKETWFAAFALWACVGLAERRRATVVGALASLVTLRSHGRLVALALFGVRPRSPRAIAMALLAGVVIAHLCVTAEPARPSQQLYVHDLAALAPEQLSWLCDVPADQCLPRLREQFQPLALDSVVWGATPLRHARSDAEVSTLFGAWLAAIVANPLHYLRHRAVIWLAMLGVTSPPWGIAFAGAVPNAFGVSERAPAGAALVSDWALHRQTSWWFRPWIFLLAGVVAALMRRDQPDVLRIPLLVAAWSFVVVSFVATPSPQLRYTFMPVLLSLVVVLRARPRSTLR